MQLTVNSAFWYRVIPPERRDIIEYETIIIENYLLTRNVKAKVEIDYETGKIFLEFKNISHKTLFRILYSEYII